MNILSLTDNAKKKIDELSSGNTAVSLSIKGGGCAGFEYKFDYIDDLSEPDDFVMDFVTFKVAIDRMSINMLDGATLDWKVNGINEEFIFRNPNEQSKCGCGVSAIF